MSIICSSPVFIPSSALVVVDAQGSVSLCCCGMLNHTLLVVEFNIN